MQLHPDVFAGWYGKGVAHSGLNRHEEAIESFERARALVPNDADTAFLLGVELIHLDRVDEALELFRDAERLGHPRAAEIIVHIFAQNLEVDSSSNSG